MRGLSPVALAVCAFLASASPVRAGLYLPGEPTLPFKFGDGPVEPLPFQRFYLAWGDIIAVSLPKSDPWKGYQKRRDALRKKGVDNLSTDEALSLSGYLIRLGESAEAQGVLRSASAKDRRDFRILANQAMAFHAANELRDALTYQNSVLDALAGKPAGLSPEILAWTRKTERALRELFRIRAREQAARQRAEVPVSLFPDLDLAAPGPPDDARRRKLAEATAVVQQLLYWLPHDSAAYWLLGELYFARGDLETAHEIFEQCVVARDYTPTGPQKEHRRQAQAERNRLVAERAERERREPEAPPASVWLPTGVQFWTVLGVGSLLVVSLVALQVRQVVRGRGRT